MSRSHSSTVVWRQVRDKHFHDYSVVAGTYWVSLAAAGCWVVAEAVSWFHGLPLLSMVLVVGMAFAASLAACFPVRLAQLKTLAIGGEMFIFLSFLLFGVPGAVLVGGVEALVGNLRDSKRLTTRVASVATAVIVLQIVMSLVAHINAETAHLEQLWIPVASMAFGGGALAMLLGLVAYSIAWVKGTAKVDLRVVRLFVVPAVAAMIGGIVAAGIHLAFSDNDPRNYVLASAVVATGMAALHYWQSGRLDAQRLTKELHRAAYTDVLTGLPNRRRFTAIVDSMLETDEPARYAVMFIDCDAFKLINDTCGHRAGDAVLCSVAERLQAHIRDTDVLARFGGDEFAVLLRHVGEEEAWEVSQRMLEAMRVPLSTPNGPRTSTLSIGIALSENGYAGGMEILRDADLAMYVAKENGKDRAVVFNFLMSKEAKARAALETDALLALDQREFTLAYQPVFRISDKKLIGFESLARWNHPTRGAVSPGVFIPTLTRLGCITRLTRQLIPKAAKQLAHWHVMHPGLKLHVNVCAADLVEPDFAEFVRDVVRTYELKPQGLVIELTESDLVDEVDATMNTLANLRAIGVGVAIDDFGTGYSSLSRLTDMPVTSYKIDAAFVRTLKAGSKHLEVVKVIVALGRTLGKGVIAEGIETDEQMELLAAAGCAYGQGFLYSRPLAESDATAKVLMELSVRRDSEVAALSFEDSAFQPSAFG